MSIDTDLSAQSAQTPDAKARKSPSTARSLMSILAWLVMLSYFSPYWGKMACGLIATVSLIAMIRPLPSLGLSSWAVSLASFLMLGVFGSMVAGMFSLFSVTTEAAQDTTRKSTQASPAAAAAPITEPGAPQKTPVADYAQLYSAVTREEWLRASNLLGALSLTETEAKAQRAELETLAVPLIRALPGSDFESNLWGYEFLAGLQPENPTYRAKLAEYQGKIESRDKAERARVLALLKPKTDQVEGITWLQHPSQPKYLNSRSTVYLYIGTKPGAPPWLRMKIQYTSSDWLFVDSVDAWQNGMKERLISGPFDRDFNSTIWEWQDVIPDVYQIELLRSLSTAKEAILRFHGAQYTRDVILSASDKKALRDVLAAYEALQKN